MSSKNIVVSAVLILMMTVLVGCGQSTTSDSKGDSAVSETDSSLEKQLVKAVGSDDPTVVASLLEAGADPNAQSTPGRPVLYLAALKGKEEAVRQLIDHGADIHADTVDGSILVNATVGGYYEIVEMLLAAGADVGGTGTDWTPGDSALHAAANGGFVEIIELLQENGAEIDQEDDTGATALMKAAGRGRPEAVSLLLENGAEINHQQDATAEFQYAYWAAGSTPLHFAVFGAHGSDEVGFLDVIGVLLENGARLDIKDEEGRTPLDIAVPETGIWKMLQEAQAGA